MPLYRIQKADGQEYGPVSADVLRQWLADGFAFPRTLAREEGTEGWQELSLILERALSAPSAQPEPRELPSSQAGTRGVPPAADVTSREPTESLARFSRNCGVFGLVTSPAWIGYLIAIAAVVAGHRALHQARKDPRRFAGRGKALTGLVLGYATLLLLAAVMGIGIPSFSRARLAASAPLCAERLQAVQRGNLEWALAHGGHLAPGLLALSNQLRNPSLLICPSRREYPDWNERTDWSGVDARWISFEYLAAGLATNATLDRTVMRCSHHRHAVYGDARLVADTE